MEKKEKLLSQLLVYAGKRKVLTYLSMVIAAARLAHVDVFAEKLPDGWNSLIGENGSELSGGFYKRMQDLQRNALEWNI
jgi:ABC-type transport system involved in Fe-S cluster assembly fused permease/ATPase subunit